MFSKDFHYCQFHHCLSELNHYCLPGITCYSYFSSGFTTIVHQVLQNSNLPETSSSGIPNFQSTRDFCFTYSKFFNLPETSASGTPNFSVYQRLLLRILRIYNLPEISFPVLQVLLVYCITVLLHFLTY